MFGQAENAAIYYEREGFSTDGNRLLGRQSAGESFLKGFVQHGDVDRLYCYTDHPGKFEAFKQQVRAWGADCPPQTWINPLTAGGLEQAGCLFYSGPGIGNFAWQRRHVGPNRYSLCGLTHTISSMEVMQAFGDFAIAPVEPWDALICTSRSVRKTVTHVLEEWADYLERRNGGEVRLPVQLPVIPLGINCDDFGHPPDGERDSFVRSFRARHGIGEGDVVFLYVGRLSSHAKAHPLPLYQALEKAARRTDRNIHLVQAGWFASRAIEDQFVKGAARFCPSVNCIFLDGRKPDIRKHIWHVADVFTSLSDNIQETFGITPVEAMAAGLPVVVSDWDGYRETVRDGVDGLLVPTSLPGAGHGRDLAYRYLVGVDGYDRFVGQVSLFTDVETEAAANAYLSLIENPDLRRKMGSAGARRARETFDWKVIIRAYQDLWAELASRRRAAADPSPKVYQVNPVPLMQDPFALFENYPTHLLTARTRIKGKPREEGRAADYLSSSLGNGVAHLLPKAEVLDKMLDHLRTAGVMSAGELGALYSLGESKSVRIVGWLLKMGLVQRVDDGEPTAPDQ